jgi:hypothetical protein
MCCITTPETAKGRMQMLSAKWIEHDDNTFAVSSADECVCLLSNPACLNSIKSKGIQAKGKGKALVLRIDFATYNMVDVPPLPDYWSCRRVSSMASVHTTTSAWTRTLAWAGQLFVGLPAAVGHARNN